MFFEGLDLWKITNLRLELEVNLCCNRRFVDSWSVLETCILQHSTDESSF